jgi:hypothetical protein
LSQTSTTITGTVATFSVYGRIGSGATDANRFLLQNTTLGSTLGSCRIDWWGEPHPSAVETLAALDRLYRKHGKDFRARYEVSVLRAEGIEGSGEPPTGRGGVPPTELSRVRQELGDTGGVPTGAEDAQ